ncbi:MAG: hypothetical protein D6785_08820, partial [Planctomycetota bacterium]
FFPGFPQNLMALFRYLKSQSPFRLSLDLDLQRMSPKGASFDTLFLLGEILESFSGPGLLVFENAQYCPPDFFDLLAKFWAKKPSLPLLIILHSYQKEGEFEEHFAPLLNLSVPAFELIPREMAELSSFALPPEIEHYILNGTGSKIELTYWLGRYLANRPYRCLEIFPFLKEGGIIRDILEQREKDFLELLSIFFWNTPCHWKTFFRFPSFEAVLAYWGFGEREIHRFALDFYELISPPLMEKIYQSIPPEILYRDHGKAAELLEEIYPVDNRPFEIQWLVGLHQERAGKPKEAGKNYFLAAEKYPLSATPLEQVSLLEKSVEAFEVAEDRENQARALLSLGWAYYHINRAEEALEALQKGRLMLRGIQNIHQQNLMDYGLLGEAMVYAHLLNDYEKATLRSQEIIERQDSPYHSWARILFGYVQFKRGMEEKGESTIRLALQEAREKHDNKAIPEGLLYLGTLLRRKTGKASFLESEACYKEVLQSQNPFLVAKALDGLGRLYSNTFKLKEALRYFDLSISLKMELCDLLGAALSLGGKGFALFQKGDFQKGVEAFLKDLEILESQKEVPASDLATVYCLIAQTYRYLQKSEEAWEFLKGAKQAEIKIPDFEVRNQIHGWISLIEGSLYYDMYESGQIMMEEDGQEINLLEKAKEKVEDCLARFPEKSTYAVEAKLLKTRILSLEGKREKGKEILETLLEDPSASYITPYYFGWIHFEYSQLLPSRESESHLAIAYEIGRKYENKWFMEKVIKKNEGQIPLGAVEIAILYGEDDIVRVGETWILKACIYDTQNRPAPNRMVHIEVFSEKGEERLKVESLSSDLDGTVEFHCQLDEIGRYRVELEVEDRASKVVFFEVTDQEILSNLELSFEEKVILRKLFWDYSKIEVIQEVTGGLGGSRLFIIQPITETGRKAAWVIGKIGKRAMIEAEREGALIFRRYHNLHAAAILENLCPESRGKAGIKYVFLSPFGKERSIVPFEIWFDTSSKVVEFTEHMFENILAPHFYNQSKTETIIVMEEYGKHFPENLVVSMESAPEGLYEEEIPSFEGYIEIPLRRVLEDEMRIPLQTGIILSNLEIEKIFWNPVEDWKKVILQLRDCEGKGLHIRGYISLFSLLRLGMDPRDTPQGRYTLVGKVIHHRHTRLEDAFKAIIESFDDPPIISSNSVQIEKSQYPHPLSLYSKLLHTKFLGRKSPIHGDLTVRNIMVDIFDQPWFIDFEYSQEDGHVLKDFIKLETSVRTFILSQKLDKIRFPEEYLLFEESLFETTYHYQPQDPDWKKARELILAIRQKAHPFLAVKNSWKEYFRCLFLYQVSLFKHHQPQELSFRQLNLLTSLVLGKILLE